MSDSTQGGENQKIGGTLTVSGELAHIVGELRRRFSNVSLQFDAPLRLLRGLEGGDRKRDALGGLAVSVMAIPQAMAYALLAGVPPIMGLWALVMVGLIAGLWCRSPHLACGPTNTLSLMLAAVLVGRVGEANVFGQVALIAVVVGGFQIAAACLGAGGLTRYISRTVVVGYMAATGVLIFLNQVPNLAGTHVEGARGLLARVAASLATLPDAHLPSLIVGGATFGCIAISRRLLPKIPAGFVGIIFGSLLAWALRSFHESLHVAVVGDLQRIAGSFPELIWPGFNLQSIYELAGPAIALGLLGCLEVSTITRSLAMRTGKSAEPNQDMFALGLGNLFGAFVGAMPSSGSFTRSEFSLRSGVTSRFGVVISSLVACVVVLCAGRLLEWIPIPSLAALIMWLSLKLVERKQLRVVLLSTYSDALVFLTTFAAAIFLRLDSAIYLGVLVSMALFLRKASQPKLMEFEFDEQGRFRPVAQGSDEDSPQVSIVHVEGELFFGGAETIQEEIWRSVDRVRTRVVVLRLRNAQNLDATGVMVLEQLIRDLRGMQIHVLISGTSPEIDRVVMRSGLSKTLGAENYFPSRGNFLDATRRAVIRANEIVGISNPQIRLFFDKDQEQKRQAAAAPADQSTTDAT